MQIQFWVEFLQKLLSPSYWCVTWNQLGNLSCFKFKKIRRRRTKKNTNNVKNTFFSLLGLLCNNEFPWLLLQLWTSWLIILIRLVGLCTTWYVLRVSNLHNTKLSRYESLGNILLTEAQKSLWTEVGSKQPSLT